MNKYGVDEKIINGSSSPRQILFLFHGYGANKENMFSVGEALQKACGDDTEVRIPDGLEALDSEGGRYWFPLNGENVEDWNNDFNKYADRIISYIHDVTYDKGLSYEDVILAGFSQGAMVALELGLRLGVKATVSFSGMLLGKPGGAANGRMKTVLIHGNLDDVIPFSNLGDASFALLEVLTFVQSVIVRGMGHCINETALERAVDFLKYV